MKRQPTKPGRASLAREDIVNEMRKDHLSDIGITKRIITRVVKAFLEVYKKAILENNRIEIRNFGVFYLKLTPGREIVHPETREKIISPPYYRICFKPSNAFRQQLKEKAKQEIINT